MELDKVPTSALDRILEDLHIKCASRLLSDIHNILDPYQMRFIDVPGLIAFLRRVGKDSYHHFCHHHDHHDHHHHQFNCCHHSHNRYYHDY